MNYSPILISVYDRVAHLTKCVESIKENKEAKDSDLFIAVDYPNKASDKDKIEKVLKYCASIDGFKSVNIIKRNKNFGAGINATEALFELFEHYDKAICMEDDNIVSSTFLEFMNDALNYYENDDRIINITGFNYPVDMPATYDKDVYIWPAYSAYGVGYWRKKFNREYLELNDFDEFITDKKLVDAFNNVAEHILPILFHGLKNGEIYGDCAISYNYFRKNKFALFPVISKVKNIGYDGSGLHCGINEGFAKRLIDEGNKKNRFVENIQPDERINNILREHFKINSATKSSLEKDISTYKENMKSRINASQKEQPDRLNPSAKTEQELLSCITDISALLKNNVVNEAFLKIQILLKNGQLCINLNLLKAICLIKMNRPEEAREAFIAEITYFPKNQIAKEMFEEYKKSIVPGTQIKSPLTGSSNVEVVQELDTAYLISLYKSAFSIDVEKYFRGLPSIKICRCKDTDYRFYYPYDISGDGSFYAALQKYDWYYMDWKWEHEIAESFLTSGDTVLEVGCGRGGFLEKISNKRINCAGLEFNRAAVQEARARGLNVIEQSIEEHSKTHNNHYDVVVLFQVLEHISEVKKFIEANIKVLKKGGRFLVSVPNNDSFLLKLDGTQLLNRPPHHMGLWNINSLLSLAPLFDLTVDRVFYEPLQEYHRQWARDLFFKKYSDSNSGELNAALNQTELEKLISIMSDQMHGHTIIVSYMKN